VVEKTLHQRSKSSTFVVPKNNFSSFVEGLRWAASQSSEG
jgi:hypothetical protein